MSRTGFSWLSRSVARVNVTYRTPEAQTKEDVATEEAVIEDGVQGHCGGGKGRVFRAGNFGYTSGRSFE